VVAGVDVAVVLHHQREAALRRVDADRRRVADPGVKRPLEIHDEDRAHVVADPLLVNSDQEVAVVPGENGPGGELGRRRGRVRHGETREPQAVRGAVGVGRTLHHRRELDELISSIPPG
jgi:hypothetical protein